MTPAYYSISEVAQIWAVSEATVRRLVKAGELEAKRVGRQLRIPCRAVNPPPIQPNG